MKQKIMDVCLWIFYIFVIFFIVMFVKTLIDEKNYSYTNTQNNISLNNNEIEIISRNEETKNEEPHEVIETNEEEKKIIVNKPVVKEEKTILEKTLDNIKSIFVSDDVKKDESIIDGDKPIQTNEVKNETKDNNDKDTTNNNNKNDSSNLNNGSNSNSSDKANTTNNGTTTNTNNGTTNTTNNSTKTNTTTNNSTTNNNKSQQNSSSTTTNKVSKIHYISVGGADATLIESNGNYALIDSANPPYKDGTPQAIVSSKKGTVTHVIEYLEKVIGCSGNGCKGKLKFVVGTHAHSDHIGGMREIASHFVNSNTTYYYRDYITTSNDLWQNGYQNSTLPNKAYDKDNDWDNQGYFNRTITAMKNAGAKLSEITNKTIDIKLGDFSIKLFNTEPATQNESICIDKNGTKLAEFTSVDETTCKGKGGNLYAYGENKNSIIELITYTGTKRTSKNLLAADMEIQDEKRLISNSSTKSLLSNLDLIKVGHHGTNTSSSIDFIKHIKPKNAIISRGSFTLSNTAIMQFRYSQMNYNTNFYHTKLVDDAIVQTFSSDGNYTFSNSDSSKNIKDAIQSFDDVKTSGKWHQLKINDELNWFYFENNEKIGKTGWFMYNEKWYYTFANGLAAKGWQYLKWKDSESWYYFNTDSSMRKGWLQHNNKWYYLGNDGAMVSNTCKTINNEEFCFNNSGVCTSGRGCN